MTDSEFNQVTALGRVREIRAQLEALDPLIDGTIIEDAEHAQMRRTARQWETKLLAAITIRKQRSDAATKQIPLVEGKS